MLFFISSVTNTNSASATCQVLGEAAVTHGARVPQLTGRDRFTTNRNGVTAGWAVRTVEVAEGVCSVSVVRAGVPRESVF